MAKKSYKQILELSRNPHYVLSDDDLEIIAQESEAYVKKDVEKREKNKFVKTVGHFEKTHEEE